MTPSHGTPLPATTLVVAVVSGITTGVGAASPAFVAALERTPAGLQGEWWRLVTPVLLNPEGVRQVLVNFAALLVVGTLVERASGRRTWGAAFLAGAVAGELAGLAWQPVGAGSSVAVCGLAGALAVCLWRDVGTMPARIGAASLVLGAVGLVIAHDLHGPALIAGVVVARLLRAS